MASFAASFASANSLFVDEEYEDAQSMYDIAIDAAGKNVTAEMYHKRASNAIKLGQWVSALRDCDNALKLQPELGVAHFKKGLVLLEQKKVADALVSFQQAQRLNYKKAANFVSRCQAQLPVATPVSDEPAVQSVPPVVIKPKVREDWCQTSHMVMLTVFVKNLKKEEVKVDIENERVSVAMTLPDGSLFTKVWDLFAAIDPQASKYTVTKYKVEIELIKRLQVEWASLDPRVAAADVNVRGNVASATSLPTPYSHKKDVNWDQLGKQVEKEEAEEKPEGDAALNKLFQTIYKDASPDVRRAMIKSYQTSGGTCLSTNWDEVQKTDYESNIVPPDGQEVLKM